MMCKVLIFGCISAAILLTAAYGAPHKAHETPLSTAEKKDLLKTLIIDLDLLKNIEEVKHLDLYTATSKQECVISTLQCYHTELQVLEHELQSKNLVNLRNIRKNLEELTGDTSSRPGCKKCEAYDKKLFPAFHQELRSILQSMLKEIL